MNNMLISRMIAVFTAFVIIVTCNNSHAADLDAPSLTLSTSGTNVQASWSVVSNATGYTLYYAPYPEANPIGSLDMGMENGISANLPVGSAFYLAVKAYSPQGNSDYSNIQYFQLDGLDCGEDYWYDWQCYSSDFLLSWGLGSVEQEYYHNDKDYDWYVDQADTGLHSNNNCGPSSVTMAAKWHDKTFDKTAEDARNMYRPTGVSGNVKMTHLGN